MSSGWTKLTPEREARLVQLLKAGQDRHAACASVGLCARTLRNWLAKGEEGDERWSEFARKVREAEAECETRAVVQIQIAGKKDWRALAWWLERRFPLRWSDAKGAQAQLQGERESMLDALVRTLQKRGLEDATEDVLRELAELGGETAGNASKRQDARH